MVYEEIGAEAFPGLPEESLGRTLIPPCVGTEVAGLNYGRHRRWGNPKRLLNAGDERHEVSNDEVERRGAALPANEADLSQPSIPFLAHRRCDPLSLEPIVRAAPLAQPGAQ
jgi:hypothetical protein